ncbi:B-cell receptor CD22-like [Symphorus nematophorus]
MQQSDWQSPSQPEDLSEDSQYAGRVQVLDTERGRRSTLRITDLTERDSAEYRFKFTTEWFEWGSSLPGTTLTVTALQVQVTKWQSPSQPKDLSEDSQYAGRVQVLDTERGRSTLRITDLTERDSAEYRFKFKTRWFEWNSILPGTTLTVTALQVQVTKVTVHQSHTEAELKCHSSCSPAAHFSYVWFKNGQKVMGKETSSYTDDFYPGDNICCAFKGHEDYRSPSLYAPRLPSVSVSPLNDIIEGRSATLTCSSDANPAATYTWYSTSETLTPLSKEPQLVFSPIKTSDSGNYYCEAENELGKSRSEDISINVKYGPKTPSLSKSLSGEIAEGSLVTLTCKSDANPAAEYVWYKKNQILPWNSKDIYRFTSISSEDSGIYHCMAVNKHGQINSTSVRIDVLFGPKLPTVSVSPPDEIMEGSSVNLTCSSDANPAATYTWYKENEDSPKASGQLFTITDIRPEHSGNYYCEASNKHGHNNSTSLLIVVASPMKSVGAGSITTILLVIFLAIISLFAFFFIRRKKSLKENTEQPDNTAQLNTGSVCNGPSAAGQRKPAEEQEDLCYASVRFFKHQEDAVYYNIRPAHSKKEEEEEEEDDVDYTIVNCNSASTFPEPGSRDEVEVEDPSALYSTVPKKTRV